MISPVLHLLVALVICTYAMRPLASARWPWQALRTAIVLWQMLIATWLLCIIGTLFAIGLSNYGPDIPTALSRSIRDTLLGGDSASSAGPQFLISALGYALAAMVLFTGLSSWLSVSRTRRRHRQMLNLVGREDPRAPNALVLDHPAMVAYCVPGLRTRVVVSSGALAALTSDQIAAVLAHQRAHARERHDLLLLPFATLRKLLPRSRTMALVSASVALLVEMRADDAACQRCTARALAGALSRFGSAKVDAPRGTLSVSGGAVAVRLHRLSAGMSPLPITLGWCAVLAGLVLVATPLSFLLY